MIDRYLIEAIDNYPYDVTQAVESLNYALSSNPSCPHALCLMGRVHAEQMQNYQEAIAYFEDALKEDVRMAKVYPYYASTLIDAGYHNEAIRAIDFAVTLKGADIGQLLHLKMFAYEYLKKYKKAIKLSKEAIENGYNDGFVDRVKDTKARIKAKMEANEPKKKTKKSKKK
jgi:tetratricopeptide (TPR) repeat protein